MASLEAHVAVLARAERARDPESASLTAVAPPDLTKQRSVMRAVNGPSDFLPEWDTKNDGSDKRTSL